MRALRRARRRARQVRAQVGDAPDGLLERLTAHLEAEHGVRPSAVGSDFLAGGRGEVAPQEGALYYDRKLDRRPAEKLELFAHELGHLTLHERLFTALEPGDPIRGSAYLDSGAPALARYSQRSREEAEAAAFAAEFLCPAAEVFADWLAVPGRSTAELAAARGVSEGLCRVQLAEGLHRRVTGEDPDPDGAIPEPAALSTHDDQERAATAIDGPVLVEAGPGTGKTRTLVRRALHLIRDLGAEPESLLILTFSNEAAEELRQRIERGLGEDDAARVEIATFHGFGVALLQSYGHRIELAADFRPLDELAQEELLSTLLAMVDCEAILELRDPRLTARRAAAEIGYLKDRLVTPERLAAELEARATATPGSPERSRGEALLRLYRAYEKAKRQADRVDFADLILLPLELLEADAEVREEVRSHHRWVMVDEYQDVSRSVARLLAQICGPNNPPWVVGDARQAIYRFRGAAPENVARFGEDFPGGRRFVIRRNYRSSPPILDAANHLAALLEGDDPVATPPRWQPGREVAPLGPEPVAVLEASSDEAERQGIAEQVEAWIAQGVPAEELGVLARRNIDVRNIALELNRRGRRAVTSGLLTAEGAAGDLAAALTLLDAPRAAAPRLAYALADPGSERAIVNEAVRWLLERLERDEAERRARDEAAAGNGTEARDPSPSEPPPPEPSPPAAPAARALAEEVRRVTGALAPLEERGDAWTVLGHFLFDASDYLRRRLTDEGRFEASLELEETVAALAFAANYRFSHPGYAPRAARRRMAERFRELLTGAAPGLIPPRPRPGAVRVMTCHAAKGLEIPAVVVAGQTLNAARREAAWLPPSLESDPRDDALQADALLFVGVTRAERALLVSWALSAGGTVRSPRRQLPALLEDWRRTAELAERRREVPPAPSSPVAIGRIWGGREPEKMSTYTLSGQGCEIRAYLQDHLRIDLRSVPFPLYAAFTGKVRRTLERVIATANERGAPLAADEAEAIAAEEWPVEQYARHPHVELYRPRALKWARRLAEVYRPEPGAEPLPVDLRWPAGNRQVQVPLQLIGRFRDASGASVAIAFRPDVLGEAGGEALKWSRLKDHHRLPLVLAQAEDPELRPLVWSGADGRLYAYRWSARKPSETLATIVRGARERFAELSRGRFETQIKDWTCDRCPCRMLCPYWIGAIDTPSPS